MGEHELSKAQVMAVSPEFRWAGEEMLRTEGRNETESNKEFTVITGTKLDEGKSALL